MLKSSRSQARGKVQNHEQYRCQKCNALLGLKDQDHIDIRRADLKVGVEGRATVTCYRCKTVNVLVYPTPVPIQQNYQADAL